VAFLWNPTNPANVVHLEDLQAGARAMGVTLHSIAVRSPTEFPGAFATILREHPDALMITADAMLQQHVGQILEFAAQHRLPVMSMTRENVLAGALMSYSASARELSRRASVYLDKILKGAKPGELPVQQPMKFELVLNLKTAKALGITMPPSLLLLADEVIQ
jgi:putative ABC transport system substrate-binding protein